MTPAAPNDSIGRGVLIAVAWQVGAIIITIPLMCTIWGLVQWAALIPMYLSQRKKGYRLAAKGLLITGFVGVMLNATCAALILGNLGNMH
ncbi:MAG: hypothetical protein ABSH56_11625 [Bryobacteraceae bacterium]|jgi:hypothetical protein